MKMNDYQRPGPRAGASRRCAFRVEIPDQVRGIGNLKTGGQP